MRQTLEKMEYHRYSSIPIINKKGEYVGTMTEGDLLWSIKNDFNLNLKSPVPVFQQALQILPSVLDPVPCIPSGIHTS